MPSGSIWRATGTGEQGIHLLFDAPLSLRHICLVFDEAGSERAGARAARVARQEMVLPGYYAPAIYLQPTFHEREIEHFYVDALLILRDLRRQLSQT